MAANLAAPVLPGSQTPGEEGQAQEAELPLLLRTVVYESLDSDARETTDGPRDAPAPRADWLTSDGGVELGPTWVGSDPDETRCLQPFHQWRCSLEAHAGVYCSQHGLGPSVPTFDFVPLDLRLGVVLHDPIMPGCLRGCWQALIEMSVEPVFNGYGHILAGPSALFRYNFVQPDWRFVPYLQCGAGFVYTDAYHDVTQHAIGEEYEFQLKAAGGFHYFLNDRWSLDGEVGYIHISNADLANRNYGINAVGGSIGVTYVFP
jgi:hypothetical protein